MKLNLNSLLLALLAAGGAGWLAGAQPASSYEDQLIGVAVRQSFGDAAPQIAAEPVAVQALLLDYAADKALVLKARLALLRYPDLARRILPVYGAEPEFRDVLLSYGEAVLLPIGYFMDHALTSLEVRRALGDQVERVKRLYAQLAGTATPESPAAPAAELTPEERGWYAVNFLREDGYRFLGQFTVGPDGTADWVQSERVAAGLADLFLGGVRSLETKWRQGQEIEAPDLAWATMDVVVIVASVKLVKAVRAAKVAESGSVAARAGGFSRRVALFGSRVLAGGGRLGIAVARYGAVPAAIYLMVRYPSLANATLAELAGWLGVEPWLVQFLFWFVVLSVLLRLVLFVLPPVSGVLRGLAWLTGRVGAWVWAIRWGWSWGSSR
jgi:hypothetical protein